MNRLRLSLASILKRWACGLNPQYLESQKAPGDERPSRNLETRKTAPIIRTIVDISDPVLQEYRENQKEEAAREGRNQTIATWAVGVAGGIALIGLVQAYLTGQAIKVNKDALEVSERPWITIDSVNWGEPPNWKPVRPGAPEKPTVLNLRATIFYDLANVGKGPAIRAFSGVEAYMYHGYDLPRVVMDSLCSVEELLSKQAGPTSGVTVGSVIFPGPPIHSRQDSWAGLPKNIGTIDRIWILACVVYQDGITTKIHHTRRFFQSVTSKDTQYEPIGPGQAVKWLPPVEFVLSDSEAD
jgi:hypothetical protein